MRRGRLAWCLWLVHTYFPPWSWQMMSWASVSLNEWAPSPSPRMPWQNPPGMARGPRHTAGPCHCRYRGTVCGKGEVLNLLTPRNKDHCEYLLPPLLSWFPLIQMSYVTLIHHTLVIQNKTVFFFLGKLFQFTQVIKRENFNIMTLEQFKLSKLWYEQIWRGRFSVYSQRKFISQKQISLPYANTIYI